MRSLLWHIFVALPCKYGLIWLLLIFLSYGARREYQNPLYNHKENWSPLPTFFLPIEYPDYSPAMACRPTVLFPNVPKGKYPVCTKEEPIVDATTSKSLRRSQGRSLEIAMMRKNSSNGTRELREKCWLRLRSSTLCCFCQSTLPFCTAPLYSMILFPCPWSLLSGSL